VNNNISVPIWEKITLTIPEAAALSNIGLNKIQEMACNPRCPFVLYVGKKKLIKRKEFTKFIEDNIEI
jgi:excisionase family DNA binding protein